MSLNAVPTTPTNNITYQVGLYLNGYRDENRQGIVIFESSEVKEQYVRNEFKFCRREEDNYNLARHKNQRDRTKDALLAKRVEFAKFAGYERQKNTSNPAHFVYVGSINDDYTPQLA